MIKTGSLKDLDQQREYNIITNRYHEEHERKLTDSRSKFLAQTEQKYKLTQAFDPIAC